MALNINEKKNIKRTKFLVNVLMKKIVTSSRSVDSASAHAYIVTSKDNVFNAQNGFFLINKLIRHRKENGWKVAYITICLRPPLPKNQFLSNTSLSTYHPNSAY